MRAAAQVSLLCLLMIPVMLVTQPRLALVLYLGAPFCLFCPAWYFLFDRHLERNDEALLLKLDAIANAIRESEGRYASAPSLRR